MNMKNIKILALLTLALPLAVFTSCTSEEDDIFADNASVRMEKAMKEAKEVLTGAENGWVMDYFVGKDQQYGGYTYIVQFDNEKVTAVSENDSVAASSYYTLTNNNGPVISFSSYNRVLHDMSTPSAENYEGKQGDFEFIIMSATADKVVLKGCQTGNEVILRPLTTTPKDYLAKVDAIQDSIAISTAAGAHDGVNTKWSLDLDNRNITIVTPTDSFKTAYVYTTDGIRLYEGVTFGDGTASDFAYQTVNKLACTDQGMTDLVLQGQLPDGYTKIDDFTGSYVLGFIDQSTGQLYGLNVTITRTGKNTLNLNGWLYNDVPVQLTYSKKAGVLQIITQKIATKGNNTIYLNGAEYNEKSGMFGYYLGITYFGQQTVLAEEGINGKTGYYFENLQNEYSNYISINSWFIAELDSSRGLVGNSFYSGEDYIFSDGSNYFYPYCLIKQ